MDNTRTIKRALISVYDKDLILDIANELVRVGAEILSTGGTRDYLVSNNIPVTPVEDLTGFPSIFGGRVKTLHPAVMGGILKRRENETDTQEGEKYNIPNIDLVIVDLYPFEDTVAKGATPEEIIEKIDIGGISLIRAAAKNYNDVVIVPSKDGYADILNILKEQDGVTTLAQRRHFAATAFLKSSSYDSHIFQYFNIEENIPAFKVNCSEHRSLRYGENPHQQAMFYGNTEALPPPPVPIPRIGCVLSAIGLFVPMYLIQAGGKTVRDGVISMMSNNTIIYGIVILLADLVVFGSALVGLKKGYVIATFISAGLSFYSCWNMMISKEASVAILNISTGLISGSDYKIADGPAMVLMILGSVVMLITMIWCGFAED